MDDQHGKDLPENEIKLGPDCELRFEVESSSETVYLEVSFKTYRLQPNGCTVNNKNVFTIFTAEIRNS